MTIEPAALNPAPRQAPVSFAPRSLAEAMEFSKLIASSNFIPSDYKGKPGDIIVAIQMGAELGLAPIQSLQNISVIKGRPSVWGDAALALVRASGLLEDFEEGVKGSGNDRYGFCRAKRRGQPTWSEQTFSVADAVRAGLWGKGTWQSYPDRMLKLRARGFALRDGFADVLKGLITREEAEDFPDVEEQVKGPVSDLPWVEADPPPATGTRDEDLAATLQASLDAAKEEGAVSTSSGANRPEVSPPKTPGEAGETASSAPPGLFEGFPPSDEPVLINETDRRRLHACREEGLHTIEQTKRWLFAKYEYTSTSQIRVDQLEEICRRLRDRTRLT